jgi:hypothetical protein
VLVNGTNHLSFTDAPFVRRGLVDEGGGALTDPARVLRVTADLITEYIRNAFAGKPSVGAPPDDFIQVIALKDW